MDPVSGSLDLEELTPLELISSRDKESAKQWRSWRRGKDTAAKPNMFARILSLVHNWTLKPQGPNAAQQESIWEFEKKLRSGEDIVRYTKEPRNPFTGTAALPTDRNKETTPSRADLQEAFAKLGAPGEHTEGTLMVRKKAEERIRSVIGTDKDSPSAKKPNTKLPAGAIHQALPAAEALQQQPMATAETNVAESSKERGVPDESSRAHGHEGSARNLHNLFSRQRSTRSKPPTRIVDA